MKTAIIFMFTILFVFPKQIYAKKKKKRISTLESFHYDKSLDKSIYMVMPFGIINLNGKWSEVKDKNPGYGKLVRNSDSIEILLDLQDCTSIFNKSNQDTLKKFAEKYFDWEKEYFEKNSTLKVEIVENDSTQKYLVYSIKGIIGNEKYETFVFVAEENCNITTMLISNYVKKSQEEKIKLFKEIYNNK